MVSDKMWSKKKKKKKKKKKFKNKTPIKKKNIILIDVERTVVEIVLSEVPDSLRYKCPNACKLSH